MAEPLQSAEPPVAQPAPAAPSYNTDALAATMRDAVKSGITELQQQQMQQQQQAQAQQAQQQAAQRLWGDPVGATVRPYLEAPLQALNLQNQALRDEMNFYRQFPEAADYQGDLKSMADQLMAQGRPMEMEAIWHYYKGKNADAFAQKAEEAKKAQLAASANQYTNVGGPAAMRPDGADLSNFRSLPVEQMRDALKGVSF